VAAAEPAEPDAGNETEEEAAQAGPMTPELARSIGANELGMVPVLEYHKIGEPEAEWTRTPENFRKDIELLKAEGYYPVNLRDLVSGHLEVPAGKSPVVLTFDDSSPGQYRILEDGSVDPDSGLGILQAAVEAGDWAPRATFFPLLEVRPDDNVLFGQPDRQEEKVRNLVAWGYELGSHTYTHLNLKQAAREEAVKQLALSKAKIESLAGGGYEVTSISIPFGEYPSDDSLLSGGEHEGITYAYTAAVEVTGGPSPSPFSDKFRPLHIPRTIVRGDALAELIEHLKQNPELRYVSDGDPAAVSAPADVAEELGRPLSELGRPLVSY
jgi:peptidoglycan/xylan/chitin deacetylase (PgdA/CDA1 family)